MRKETKEAINKELIEKMDKNLSCKKEVNQLIRKSEEKTKDETIGYLSRKNFDRVASYYMTHVEEPLDILFCDMDKAYQAYITDGTVFHASIVEIINKYKDNALQQAIRPLIAVQVLGNIDKKNKLECQRMYGISNPHKDGVERVFEECLELYKRKNHDYSNKGESAFDKAYNKMGAKSLWLRLNDKFTRFESLLFADDEAQVKDEKIEDTLLDLINYAAMGLAKLKGYN